MVEEQSAVSRGLAFKAVDGVEREAEVLFRAKRIIEHVLLVLSKLL